MTKLQKIQWWQVGACLACLLAVWPRLNALGSSEFSGGSATGVLFTLCDRGSWLLVAAALVTFVHPRMAAVAAFAACLICAPLYLYFLAPGLFRRILGGQWTTALPEAYRWDFCAIVGMVTLAVAVSICVRSLLSIRAELPLGGNSALPPNA
jgi:hypothetical protein